MTFSENDTHRVSPTFQPDIDDQTVLNYDLPNEQRKAKAKMGHDTTFGMSGKEWRHLAGHHLVEQWRDGWKRRLDLEVDDGGMDASTITSQIITAKTVVVDVYLGHLRTTFRHVDFLKKYHSKEHRWNFFKYRREQKALCEVVRRVKGEDGVGKHKSQIVVAFGNGKFGNSGRKGSRGAPVERFKRHLRKHVTLVLGDEYRTSRVCSKCWMQNCWDDIGDTSNLNSQALCLAHALVGADDDNEEDLALNEVEGPSEGEEDDDTATKGQKQW